MFTVDLPLWDDHLQLLHHQNSTYGLANIATLDLKTIMSQLLSDPDLARWTKAARDKGAEDLEILAGLPYAPWNLTHEDYTYASGRSLAGQAILDALTAAFDPSGQRPQTHRIEDRLLSSIKTGSQDHERKGTIFYQLDESKPLDKAQLSRAVLFRDKDYIQSWLRWHPQERFDRRSDTFAGRIDFLATTGNEALYKGFLLEGVTISKGKLVGRSERTMIDLNG